MSFYKPERGDRVRVVLEGNAHNLDPVTGDFNIGFNRVAPQSDHTVSIEKVEPPVVTFKPGDVVRHEIGLDAYTLTQNGYINHQTGGFVNDDSIDETFNSRLGYAKVELK